MDIGFVKFGQLGPWSNCNVILRLVASVLPTREAEMYRFAIAALALISTSASAQNVSEETAFEIAKDA